MLVTQMNWIDFLLLILLLVSVVKGGIVGAVRRIIQIAAVLIALAECWRLAPFIRDSVFPAFGMERGSFSWLIPILSFGLIYFAIALAGRWISARLDGGILGFFNHVFGAVLGLVIGIYALGYVLTFVDYALPSGAWLHKREINDPRRQSSLYAPIKGSIVDLQGIEAYIRGDAEEQVEGSP